MRKKCFQKQLKQASPFIHVNNSNNILLPSQANLNIANTNSTLFRYRSNPDFYLDEIKKEYIYMASLTEINDPFDCFPAMSKEVILEKKYQKRELLILIPQVPFVKDLFKKYRNCLETISVKDFCSWISEESKKEAYLPFELLFELLYKKRLGHIENQNHSTRIACFSETNTSVPMWAYYANNHTGICIEYDFSLLNQSLPQNKIITTGIQKVWYSKNRFEDSDNTFSPYVKNIDWAHEHEWRLASTSGEQKLFLPCITAIYLGINFADDLMKLIKILNKSSRKIDLFQMCLSQENYELKADKISYN